MGVARACHAGMRKTVIFLRDAVSGVAQGRADKKEGGRLSGPFAGH